VVVANGVEAEPVSRKDSALLTTNPHLVLDGVLLAARLVRAREAIVAVARGSGVAARVQAALAERPDCAGVRLVLAPDRFVAGEETALVRWLNGGEAKPTYVPPRPFERGVRGRPTLVQNVETLAGLALVGRYGAEWFRELGTPIEPGSVLATVSGAVVRPGVLELELGSPVGEAVERCGGLAAPAQALLVGGYFGRWLPADLDARLSSEGLAHHGARLGARAVVMLPEGACGVAETARVATYLAAQSAGQCGPCVFGLRAVADALDMVARCDPRAEDAYRRLPRLGGQVAGRGACSHPDGAIAFVGSALDCFAGEFHRHLDGRCSARDLTPVLPTPAVSGAWR
jgi:NADH:ubiquinone oxidoreductase subunit F (NADH-binding)